MEINYKIGKYRKAKWQMKLDTHKHYFKFKEKEVYITCIGTLSIAVTDVKVLDYCP